MMPLSEVLSFLAESCMRLIGAVLAVLFGFGYLGQFTGQAALRSKPVRLVGLFIGIAVADGGSALVRRMVGS